MEACQVKTLITEFISLDGVVQAPGGASEDTDGGFTLRRMVMEILRPGRDGHRVF